MKKRSSFSPITLLGRASVVALAIGLGAGAALGQKAFQGVPSYDSGVVSITQGDAPSGTPGTDRISILNASTAIIDWTADDTPGTGPVDFLPEGRTAIFDSFSNFTVLNRILPANASIARVMELNGTVQSTVNGSPGGSVWFYAPGGIVAGPNSVFNVGSLLLTSNDIDTTGGLFGQSGEIRFRGPTNVLSSVEVKPGASIEALANGSYVALVAPRVVQGGTVKVNGTAAYVAAEQADIRINGGLFDISIIAGTTDANGVVHSGTTERESSTVAPGETQRVYMVAVPKNNALTMLLSGDVGYSAADTAVQDGSTVVLAAGYDVAGTDFINSNPAATGKSSINIGASTWQPELNARVTGDISLRANAGQAITAGGDMNLTAGSGAMGGRIELLTFGGAGPTGNNGRIDVAGALRVQADAFGDGDFMTPLPPTGSAIGGDIVIAAAGGSISAATLTASASATSGVGIDRSGDATGGSISLSALTFMGSGGPEAGALRFGNMSLTAAATVGDRYSYTATGGSALGGKIDIAATGGSVTADSLFLNVSGTGGNGSDLAGSGKAGDIILSASAASGLRGRFVLTDCSFVCDIAANGFGGNGPDGAAGTGGTVLIYASDADFTVTGGLEIRANGLGGEASNEVSVGRGGDGVGGALTVESRAGLAGTGVMSFGDLLLSADGGSFYSGVESVSAFSSGGPGGGDGLGGTTNILIAGGSLTANSIIATASAFGGAANVYCEGCSEPVTLQSGTGRGGSVGLLMTGGSADIGLLELAAAGGGGEAATGYESTGITALAGQGIGGDALLDWRGGALTAGSVLIDASGQGGSGGYTYDAAGGAGGEGIGGSARLLMAAGGVGQISVADGIIVGAAGYGGDGGDVYTYYQTAFPAGDGGTGRGGSVDVSLAGGALTTPSLFVSAAGAGGAGGDNESDAPGGAAGSGFGGAARFSYLSEGHDIASLTLTANGEGGLAGVNRVFAGYDSNFQPIYAYGPANGSAGGAGTGGTADMLVDVDPNFVTLEIRADGLGSDGSVGAIGGAGGIGQGGSASLNIGFGATTVSSSLRVSAIGVGGKGGDGLQGSGGLGGDAFGGSATLGLTGSSTSLDAGDLSVVAEALGGAGGIGGLFQTPGVNGANGGSAIGGTALFEIANGATATTGAVLKLSADATGGDGSAGTAGPLGGAGGSGGSGVAGAATLRINGGRLRYAASSAGAPAYSITAVGMGGTGAAGGDGSDPGQSGGTGGNGGSGTGGVASFEATNGDYLLGSLSITANGIGALGGAGGVSPTGASPGGATGLSSGGTAQLLNGGGTALAPGAMRQLAALSMTANGAQGGRILFTDNSTGAGGGLVVTGSLNLHAAGAQVAGFTGIDVSAQANAVQVGGDVDFLTDGPLTFAFAGAGGIAAAGAMTGYIGSGIMMSHASRAAGSYGLSAASIYLQSSGAIGLAGDSALGASGALTLLAQGGDISLSGNGLLNAGADLHLAAQGSLLGAAASLTAGGDVAIGVASSGDILLGSLTSGGLLDMANASGNPLGLGGISIGGDFVVGGRMQVGAGSGTLSAASIRIGHLVGGSQTLTAPGGIEIGDADLSGLLQLRSTGTSGFARLTGTVNAGSIDIDATTITSNALAALAGDLLLQSVADLSFGQAQAAGNIALGSSSGSLTIGSASAGGTLTLAGAGISAQALASGGSVLLNAGTGDLSVTNIASGPITAFGRNISLGSSGGMTIASAIGSGDVALGAGGLLTLTNQVSGGAVTLGSGDIVIGPNAQVLATGLLQFKALGIQQPAIVGGADATSGYSLSAAELARVSAANLAIDGAGDIIVRDLAVGTAIIPGDGILSLNAAGLLRVEGALALTGRTAQGGASLSAGNLLQVIAGSGSIDISDGNGALGGVLALSAPVIQVATLSAIDDLASIQSLGAKEARLAQNDGLVSENGWLRAGTIQLSASQGVYVQNSGMSTSFADRRGFTANNLILSGAGGAPEVAINGRIALASGEFVTGIAAIPLMSVNGRSASGSKINGCLIDSPGSCTGAGTGSVDNRDTLDVLLDPTVAVARLFPPTLIQLRDVVTQGYPPLIDEPVTGAGNEDLWESPCGGEGQAACSAQ